MGDGDVVRMRVLPVIAMPENSARRCPNCGEDALYYEPMCKAGTRRETTSGIACMECHWYELGATFD